MTLSRHFSLHRADASTNARETGSNWVDLSLFGQILIVPGAVNNEIEAKGKFRNHDGIRPLALPVQTSTHKSRRVSATQEI